MTGSTSEIYKSSFSQQIDAMPIGEYIFINLRFDVDLFHTRCIIKGVNLDFIIKMADITYNGFVIHSGHMIKGDHIFVAGSRYKNIPVFQRLLDGGHFKAFHGGLQGTDGINLGNFHPCTVGAHGFCTSFAYVTISQYDDHLAGNHHIRSAFNPVSKGFATTVKVIEL